MYQFLHSLTTAALFGGQLPPFLAALLIAEFFYKFHSFTLECLAFLITWYVLDALLHAFLSRRASENTD
jgi:hypothetical protein